MDSPLLPVVDFPFDNITYSVKQEFKSSLPYDLVTKKNSSPSRICLLSRLKMHFFFLLCSLSALIHSKVSTFLLWGWRFLKFLSSFVSTCSCRSDANDRRTCLKISRVTGIVKFSKRVELGVDATPTRAHARRRNMMQGRREEKRLTSGMTDKNNSSKKNCARGQKNISIQNMQIIIDEKNWKK